MKNPVFVCEMCSFKVVFARFCCFSSGDGYGRRHSAHLLLVRMLTKTVGKRPLRTVVAMPGLSVCVVFVLLWVFDGRYGDSCRVCVKNIQNDDFVMPALF